MVDPAVPWDLYRSFLAVVRHGSLSAAARALKLTQPTLGRHIEQLEQALGAPMFTRSPAGLTPTDTALALAPIAEAMESAAQAMARTATDRAGDVSGAVRITVSEVIGAEVLPDILARFADRHPAIVFELNLSNRPEDLLRRDADIAVRMVRPTQEGLVAQRLGETVVGFFARRSYLDAAGEPRNADDLARLRVIGFDRAPVPVRAVEDAGIPISRDLFSLRTDSDLAQLAAVRAGYGIGACQLGVARRDPGLVRVLPDLFAFSLEMWLVMHADLRSSLRLRLVWEHLAEGLRAYLRTSRRPEEVVRPLGLEPRTP